MRFNPPVLEDIPSVREMVALMDETVTGLEATKLRLALHMRRFMLSALHDRATPPQNVLVIGPSGGGKTFMLRKLLEVIPVIWTEANATEFSDVGYVGRDLASAYLGLFQPKWRGHKGDEAGMWAAPEMTALAERWGVVIIDEFDKLRADAVPKQGERAVGRALQAELLKLSEGTEALAKRNDDDRGVFINTQHILHIAVGAFQGLNRTVAFRDNPELDPANIPANAYERCTIFDIIKYGFLEELVGRFSTIVTLPPLDSKHMARILRDHVLPAFREACYDDGVYLEIEDGAVAQLATRSSGLPIGARALVPMLDDCLHKNWAQAQRGDTLLLTAASVIADSSVLMREKVLA
jgi:ATP-dependent Clp protease ATP-binding subunit ClpX